MRLKSIEMTGFKSFADKTYVEFGNGITAIVGPNGSGKSNISDAVRWVMGEQSAKSLRSGNMQDVIFSGTQKRKPLGFAEVTLVVDNSDRALKIDYDEVAVTRRVFRSGEGEYFINKTAVRMKDIHELFMDTGIGRDGYSIISQGRVAEILSNKPEERRQMFEEASGITKYRYRKEEAQRKLARTTENIVRLNDIITELENQVEPLRIQSEKAKKYLIIRDELRAADVNLSLYNIEKNKNILKEIEGVYDNLCAQIESVNEKSASAEQKSASLFEKINSQDALINEKRAELESLNATRSEFQSDIAILNNRIENNKESIKRIKTEIEELKIKALQLDESMAQRESSDSFYDKYEDLKAKTDETEKQLSALREKIAAETAELERTNTEIIEKMNDVSELRYKITGNAALKSTLNERADAINRELAEKGGDYDKLKDNVSAADKNVKELQNRHEEQKNKLSKAQSDLESSKKLISRLQTDIYEKRSTLSQQKSRLKLLKDLERSFDNYSRSVKSVMTAYKRRELGNATLYGTVAGLLTVESRYAAAMETALGGAAQNIVTKNENDAKTAIAYLKRAKQGRATFLPLDVCRGEIMDDKQLSGAAGYLGVAASLVKCEPQYKGVINQLLGRIAVVDNIDNAVIIANKFKHRYRIVTLEGDLLSPGGSMTGGSRQSGNGIFSRAGEIAELEKIIPKNEQALSEDEKRFAAETAALSGLEKAVTDAAAQEKQLGDKLISLTMEARHGAQLLAGAKEAKEALLTELEQLKAQLVKIAELDESGSGKIDEISRDTDNLKSAAAARKQNLELLKSRGETTEQQLLEYKMQLGEIKKDIERINEITEMSNARKSENSLAVSRKHENIAEIEESISNINDDIKFKNEQISQSDADIADKKAEIEALEGQSKAFREDIKKLQDEQKQIHETQMTLQQEQGRLDSKKAKAESDLESIVNRLWDDYELSLIEAQKLRTEIQSVSETQKKIASLKGQIKSLGNINVDSIEEYKAVKERYDFLTEQRTDLLKAQSDLETVISEMLEIMKVQFAEKFKEISGHFNNIFVELFGGGKGAIRLTDPSNILESGIDIDVNPPGKAIKSIMQLSGGEQAMVSIALLFSILKVRPAPFCILDEIEAALDDVNVYRFADFLNKNIGKTQYIVVTHRRGTMEAANILYGVTMQEKGVTKMLSLNIDDVVDAV